MVPERPRLGVVVRAWLLGGIGFRLGGFVLRGATPETGPRVPRTAVETLERKGEIPNVRGQDRVSHSDVYCLSVQEGISGEEIPLSVQRLEC